MKRLWDIALPIIITVVTICAVIGYFSQQWLGHDNVIEEGAEEVIEAHTGVKIDLSPSTPEDQKDPVDDLSTQLPSSHKPKTVLSLK